MTEMQCTYSGNRDETIVSYLYGDITPLDKAAFESHLRGCGACQAELDELRGVRAEMRDWSPPVFHSTLGSQQTPRQSPSFWREMPAWAQTAAALLVVGVAAGAANINVHHDAGGFTVRTGWMQAPAPAPAAVAQADPAPWRADLAKLESQIQSSQAAAGPRVVDAVASVAPRPAASDEELLRKVKALLADSEKREETELALRIAQVVHDRQAERVADLTNIERRLGMVQTSTTNTGFVVQRLQENQNTLLRRVSETVR
jgi:hypothetical protein